MFEPAARHGVILNRDLALAWKAYQAKIVRVNTS